MPGARPAAGSRVGVAEYEEEVSTGARRVEVVGRVSRRVDGSPRASPSGALIDYGAAVLFQVSVSDCSWGGCTDELTLGSTSYLVHCLCIASGLGVVWDSAGWEEFVGSAC